MKHKQKELRVIHPDGRQERQSFDWTDPVLKPIQTAVGGWIAVLPAHHHALVDHEVVVHEAGLPLGLPINMTASRLIGMDLRVHPPLRGPVVIMPHDPADGPSPAQRRLGSAVPSHAMPDTRVLEGDAVLNTPGVGSVEQPTGAGKRHIV